MDCTPTYTMFVVGFMSVSSISSVLLYILLSLQHARCRIVVTQIPVGPLAVLVYDVGPEKPREAGRG